MRNFPPSRIGSRKRSEGPHPNGPGRFSRTDVRAPGGWGVPDLRFIPLASSSHGNAYLLDDGKTCLLIECGVSYKKLQRLTGFGVSGIIGCLISHEHHDHAGCYEQLIKSGIPVYASRGTAEALECDLFEILEDREQVTIGSFDVLPFPTFHDAAEPMGFLIRSQVDGDKLVFATDTVNLGYQFPGVNIAAIECNYDEKILSRAERMPEKVRHRITNSHMSVVRVGQEPTEGSLSNASLRCVFR